MKISTRKLSEINKVLRNPAAHSSRWTYLMIRSLPILSKGSIRCDLTILRSCRLGKEYNKTFGHIHHPPAPETYKVVFGKALFLMQRMGFSQAARQLDPPKALHAFRRVNSQTVNRHSEFISESDGNRQILKQVQDDEVQTQSNGNIEEIKLIPVAAGDKITIPAGWYHKTINLGKRPLILVNWIEKNIKNDYKLIGKKQGFGYYVVASRDKEYELVKNKNYGEVPKAKIVEIPKY